MVSIEYADSCSYRDDDYCDITFYYVPGSKLPKGVEPGTYYWRNMIRVEVRNPDGSGCTKEDRAGICIMFKDSGAGPGYYQVLHALLGEALYRMLIPEWRGDEKGAPCAIVTTATFGPNMSDRGDEDFSAEGFDWIMERLFASLSPATPAAMP